MAELLIRATGHWMDKLSKEEVDKMDESQKQSYEARSQKGDIIVVRPDGWKWGKLECLPDFIVTKVKGTEAEWKHLEQSLTEEKPDPVDDKKTIQVMLKHRKNAISTASVEKVTLAVKDLEEITPFELTINEPITEKVRA